MSVTDVGGFVASGIGCGIKLSGEHDMAIVATADFAPVNAAGVFTSNKMTAAPVLVCREHLAVTQGTAAAVVLNSGNANAATGKQGMADARRMCELTAAGLGVVPQHVLVCSTGLIGYGLPMDKIAPGISAAIASLSASGGPQAAQAIMTTDTVPKQVTIASNGFTVGGIAKGAAMLEPNMATMLAVLTTDAASSSEELVAALRAGVASTFNTLTVDGAESTNDTVLILANGQAGAVAYADLVEAVIAACESLAMQMADDAEGSTKTVFLRVTGAASDAEAAKAARDTANCQLVKCSWYGQDPYWGRIASEMGAAGVAFDHTKLTIAYGPHVVYDHGEPAHPSELAEYMAGRHLELNVDLGMGNGTARIITTDLTHAYVDENMGTS
ncbi:MAG: bifunctional glutamate N-acetyltransferase/amino-acid acetyltransferase ArgJ [Acidimicrobiia bacterium]|nr:bifunctional glutamate N-acetyltransferase/amino-acid acetyltransferase ArgJ [Acidimicrobiia bacterium]